MQWRSLCVALVALCALSACGEDGTTRNTSADMGSDQGADLGVDLGGAADMGGTTPVDCATAQSGAGEVVCAAEAFLATLTAQERAIAQSSFDDAAARTTWSNLPGVTRNGLALGDMSEATRAAAMTLASKVLSADGYDDWVGILAADDYLGQQGGGGGPGGGSQYSSDNYHVAILGAPSLTSDWMLQLGGHHMAFNITWRAGKGYPVPLHQGVEPKGEFTLDGESYAPLVDEGEALVALFASLNTEQLATAYLSGQSFADVLVGPDNGSGVLPDDYPAGANRKGLLISALSEAQRALALTVIRGWVADYQPAISDDLMTAYTSDEALADTYIAWAGAASGPDIDADGTYFRVDGPRLWIEVACQSGVVIRGQTHFHTIYRDKSQDYGGGL